MKQINKCTRVGSEQQYGPRLAGEILHDYLENSNEPLACAYRERSTETDGPAWHPNTEQGCDLKTILRSDRKMKTGKEYVGVLRRDSDAVADEFLYCDPHLTFVETVSATDGKRNPHVFVGRYITITRKDDGSLRPNFKPMPVGMSAGNYAFEVFRELRQALTGLVEEVEG